MTSTDDKVGSLALGVADDDGPVRIGASCSRSEICSSDVPENARY